MRALLPAPSASVQRLVGLAGVARGCVLLADGRAVAALRCVSLPLGLRGADEAPAVVEAFAEALRALPVAAQLLTEARPLDLDRYLAAHAAATAAEPSARLRERAAEHRAFAERLAAGERLLERRSYLLLAPPAPAATRAGTRRPTRRWPPWRRRSPADQVAPALSAIDRRQQAHELDEACRQVAARLAAAGVGSRRLDDAELAGLLVRWALPGVADRQPLPADLSVLATGPVRYRARVAAAEE